MRSWYCVLIPLVSLCFALPVHGKERWLFIGDSITQAGHYVDYIETWFLLNEADAPEIISLGLSSETISGLSEPGHPFPRPYIHNRLSRVLERVLPDRVIACYGMNCAIYHPWSDERFAAYRAGVEKLIGEVEAIGADLVLLTPPPFASRIYPQSGPAAGDPHGYGHPAANYGDVLAGYAAWIMSLDARKGVRVIDIRPGLDRFMEASYPREPVHPNPFGHELMAESFLRGLGRETGSTVLETGASDREADPRWVALHGLVRQQRETWDQSLLNDIGHGNPHAMERLGLPLPLAEDKVREINAQIDALVSSDQGAAEMR